MKHEQDFSKMDLLKIWITRQWNMKLPGKYTEEPQKIQRRNLGLACVAC